MNETEIRAFQAKPSYDWEGKPLLVDGNLGPRTRWAMAVADLDPRRQAIVANACGFVGLVERATNRGPEIDSWLQRCGAPLGSPWCAAFASWCISVNGLEPIREASAQRLGKRLRVIDQVLPGDVMWFPTGEWTGHCGIVVGLGTGEVACVEGNHVNAVRLVRRPTSGARFSSPVPPPDLPGIPTGLPLVPVRYEGTR